MSSQWNKNMTNTNEILYILYCKHLILDYGFTNEDFEDEEVEKYMDEIYESHGLQAMMREKLRLVIASKMESENIEEERKRLEQEYIEVFDVKQLLDIANVETTIIPLLIISRKDKDGEKGIILTLNKPRLYFNYVSFENIKNFIKFSKDIILSKCTKREREEIEYKIKKNQEEKMKL